MRGGGGQWGLEIDIFIGLPRWCSVKETAWQCRAQGCRVGCGGVGVGGQCFIPGSGSFPGGGNGNPLWYFCLGNPMDRRAWQVIVHGVAKCQTRLSMRKHACNTKEIKSFALKIKNCFVT